MRSKDATGLGEVDVREQHRVPAARVVDQDVQRAARHVRDAGDAGDAGGYGFGGEDVEDEGLDPEVRQVRELGWVSACLYGSMTLLVKGLSQSVAQAAFGAACNENGATGTCHCRD